MLRALTVCFAVLAVAAPAAGAADFPANTGNAQPQIDLASTTGDAVNTVTLAAGSYGSPLTITPSGHAVVLVGSGTGTLLPALTINGGTVSIRRAQVTGNISTSGSPLLRIDNSILRGSLTTSSGSSVFLQQVTALAGLQNSSGLLDVKNSILTVTPSGSDVRCAFSMVTGSVSQCYAGNNGSVAIPASLSDVFVSPPTDLHLKPGSPAIDHGAGTSLDPNTESTVDLDGRARVVRYDSCDPPVRDMGAYEAPGTTGPPLVGISGPISATAGQNTSYTMTGPGAPSVPAAGATWSFSDGGTGTGPVVPHAWSVPGTFVVTLTARLQNGCSTTATSTVTVAPALAPPPPPDKVAPRLTNVKLSSKTLTTGKQPTLTIHVSETTTVIATVMRRDKGVYKGSKCVAPKKGRKGKGCLRDKALSHAGFRIGQGTHKVKLKIGNLKAGPYVLELTSKDDAGNPGKTVRLGFTVKKKPKKK